MVKNKNLETMGIEKTEWDGKPLKPIKVKPTLFDIVVGIILFIIAISFGYL